MGYAYRIVDENCWNAWLSQIAGHPTADLEVVHRTLRVAIKGQQHASPKSRRKPNEVVRRHRSEAAALP